MSLIYTPKHFSPQELIAPRIYAVCGADALYMYDPKILKAADEFRKIFGPMIANTYHSPKMIKKYGRHRFRGLRPLDCKIGASKSAHKVGIKKLSLYSAIDLIPLNISAQEIRESVKKDQKYWNKYFSRMEELKKGKPISWLHFDSKPVKGHIGIKFFNV